MTQPYRSTGSQAAPLSPGDLRAIIVDGDAEKTVTCAQAIGEQLKNRGLRSNQIRRIFTAVREVDMDWPRPGEAPDAEREKRAVRGLILLKPKLVYQERRNAAGGDAFRYLRDVLDPAIDLVGKDRERFGYLLDFFEAILAYHRFYGGD